jgi:hypothetical protein
MKKLIYKYLATVIVFTVIALLPLSCGIVCNDSCGCGPQFEVKDFQIVSFETLSLTKTGQRVNPTTSLPYDQIFKAFRILETQTVASGTSNFALGIPGVALACSPLPSKSARQVIGIQLINIKEVTLGDGEILKVGQDITEFFEINYFFSEKTMPFESFFKLPITIYREDIFKLGWRQDPKKEVILEFNIGIFMTDGKEFNLNNEMLSIR